jgi:hypothetical protein
MAAGTAQFPKPPDRKLSKKKAALMPKQWAVIGTNSIQGTYMYSNKCNNVFQATIECGLFGEGDPELCKFSEYKVGDVVTECDEGEVVCVPLLDGNGFLKINDKLPSAGQLIDPNIVCTFSGTFRASSAMGDHNMLYPIPLATSNGCPTTTTNFQTVVKGMVKEDGNLELDFSSDYGLSYYTKNENVCPYSYIAKKVPNENEGQGRALAHEGHVYRRTAGSFVVMGLAVCLFSFGAVCSF